MFGKIFESTFTGSMFGAGPRVFAIWGYIIANAKPATREDGSETGIVEVNPPLVSACIGMTVAEVEEVIDYLTKPDPRSRSQIADGRRLLPIGGSFLYEIPTFAEYHRRQTPEDRKEQTRKRVAAHRAKRKGGDVTHVTLGNACNATQKQMQKETQMQTMDGRMDGPVRTVPETERSTGAVLSTLVEDLARRMRP